MPYLLVLLCLSLASFANAETQKISPSVEAVVLSYTIIAERSHESSLFTEGLFIDSGHFYESSGRYGQSMLVSYPIVEPTTTRQKIRTSFSQKKVIPQRYFAEGLTQLNNKLYQLTWKEGTLFIYDSTAFTLIHTLSYSGEGWGLTNDGKQLIRSDGSSTLFFHNPIDFSITKTLTVRLNQKSISNLNELEYSDGFIWANIWQDNRIMKINASTGDVVGIVDLSAIAQNIHLNDPDSVLNGIAYDEAKKALWVTGKQWPKMFLIKVM